MWSYKNYIVAHVCYSANFSEQSHPHQRQICPTVLPLPFIQFPIFKVANCVSITSRTESKSKLPTKDGPFGRPAAINYSISRTYPQIIHLLRVVGRQPANLAATSHQSDPC